MTLADPVLSQMGQIVAAYEIQHGSALSSDLTAGATYLAVEDLDDFADAGGELYLSALEDADSTTPPLVYLGLDRDLSRILLAVPYDATELPLFVAGDGVWISPPATERRADVALDGEEDQIVVCRIPYALSANIPLGVREERVGRELALVEADPIEVGLVLDHLELARHERVVLPLGRGVRDGAGVAPRCPGDPSGG